VAGVGDEPAGEVVDREVVEPAADPERRRAAERNGGPDGGETGEDEAFGRPSGRRRFG